jgi:sulfane dehydrogenase subunit SoxC
MPSKVTRRDLLAGAAGAIGAATLAPAGRRVHAQDTTKSPGGPASALGARSPHEPLARGRVTGLSSRTPLQDLHGMITPSDVHFERHHGGVPAIDPDDYRLLIHGLVERPTILTLAELKRFPATSRICFLECSGNYPTGAGPETRPELVCGMTSTTEWTGVTLATLFREVGASPGATWFLAEGQDAAVMTRSVPMEKAWDDAMIAYAQNGEALRPSQGYPARLLLPGWEGNSNVKWLRRLELADQPFMTREETSKYTDPLADGTARQFSFVFDARSIITSPAYPDVVEPGWIEIRGIAWSGRGTIAQVDVSTDGGRTWQAAQLQEPVLRQAHTRFRHVWRWDGSETEIMSRATDDTGYVQPTRAALRAVRGRRARGYHLNPITAWRIQPNGQVYYREEPPWDA